MPVLSHGTRPTSLGKMCEKERAGAYLALVEYVKSELYSEFGGIPRRRTTRLF